MEHFHRMGFPTSKNEEWKYTNINPIVSKDFSFSVPVSKISKEEILERFPFVKGSVFVVIENGKVNFDASELKELQNGIEINNLKDVKNNALVQKHVSTRCRNDEGRHGSARAGSIARR